MVGRGASRAAAASDAGFREIVALLIISIRSHGGRRWPTTWQPNSPVCGLPFAVSAHLALTCAYLRGIKGNFSHADVRGEESGKSGQEQELAEDSLAYD